MSSRIAGYASDRKKVTAAKQTISKVSAITSPVLLVFLLLLSCLVCKVQALISGTHFVGVGRTDNTETRTTSTRSRNRHPVLHRSIKPQQQQQQQQTKRQQRGRQIMGAQTSKGHVISLSMSTTGTTTIDAYSYDMEVTNDVDGYKIPCSIWTPAHSEEKNSRKQIRAAAFLIHGGMFSKNDRHDHADLTQALVSQLGMVVITANFRDGSATTYGSGVWLQDLKSVARYMMDQYPNLPFGLFGCSSGGWFSMALANELDYGLVQFCIPVCPVSNPHARAMYLKHCIENTTPLGSGKDLYHPSVRHQKERAQQILNNQLKFFETYKQMSVAATSVEENVNKVPTLLILGSEDRNVPIQVQQNAIISWASRTVIIGDGAGHELQVRPLSGPFHSYLPDIDRFLHFVLKEVAVAKVHRPWCS